MSFTPQIIRSNEEFELSINEMIYVWKMKTCGNCLNEGL